MPFEADTAAQEPFRLFIEDVFRRNLGRLVTVTGRIERGQLPVDADVELVGYGARWTGRVELLDSIPVPNGADLVCLRLLNAPAEGLEPGQALVAPGTMAEVSCFVADLTVKPEADGGAELEDGTVLQLHVRSASEAGRVGLPPGSRPILPSHGGTATITLARPVPLELGTQFAFRHRARAAGHGTVTAFAEASARNSAQPRWKV